MRIAIGRFGFAVGAARPAQFGAIVLLLLLGHPAAAQSFSVLAKSGDAAPGLANASISSFTFYGLRLNEAGYAASLTGTGVTSTTNQAIFNGVLGSPAPIVRKGDLLPGSTTDGYASLGSYGSGFGAGMYIDSSVSNRLAFMAGITGPSVSSLNDTGLFYRDDSGVVTLARRNDPVPGLSGVYLRTITPIAMFGGSSVYTDVSGSTSNTDPNATQTALGLWKFASTGSTPVVQIGQAAPGTMSSFTSISLGAANPSGQYAIMGAYSIPFGTRAGVWANTGAGLQLIATEGILSPGTGGGAWTNSFGLPAMNGVGRVAFTAGTTGGTLGSVTGLWAGTADNPQLIVRTGVPVPSTATTTLNTLALVSMNTNNDILFKGRIADPQNLTTPLGLFLARGGSFSKIFASGDAAPGCGPGVTFIADNFSGSNYAKMLLNNNGLVVFQGKLTAAGFGNDEGVWFGDGTSLGLLLRKGDMIDVDNGPGVLLKTVNALTLSNVSDSNAVMIHAGFTDSTSALLLFPVPEPSLLLVVALLLILASRVARHRMSMGRLATASLA